MIFRLNGDFIRSVDEGQTKVFGKNQENLFPCSDTMFDAPMLYVSIESHCDYFDS